MIILQVLGAVAFVLLAGIVISLTLGLLFFISDVVSALLNQLEDWLGL